MAFYTADKKMINLKDDYDYTPNFGDSGLQKKNSS